MGVFLLFVPAAFTIFPEISENLSVRLRLVIAVAWLVLGFFTIRSATIRDLRMAQLTESIAGGLPEQKQQLRTTAFFETLRTVLTPGSFGIPESFEFTVYLLDPTDGRLRPIYPVWNEEEGEDVRVFKPGKGSTGVAYKSGSFVVVKDDAVSNTKYGLSKRQQTYWGEYRRAISYPLYQDQTVAIGALTALSKDKDDFFDEQEGRDSYKRLANVVAVILLAVAPALDPVGDGD